MTELTINIPGVQVLRLHERHIDEGHFAEGLDYAYRLVHLVSCRSMV